MGRCLREQSSANAWLPLFSHPGETRPDSPERVRAATIPVEKAIENVEAQRVRDPERNADQKGVSQLKKLLIKIMLAGQHFEDVVFGRDRLITAISN